MKRETFTKKGIGLIISTNEILESEAGTFVKLKSGKTVALDFPFEYETLNEAEYKGKKVSLNKPKSGGPKKVVCLRKKPKNG